MGDITAEKLTKAYIKIRDERAKLSAEYKEKDSVLSRQLERVKQGLLDYCNDHSVESVRTSEGLFYRSVKQKFWTNDWEKMHAFIMEHNVPELLEKRLNQTNLKQFLEENPESQPDCLNVDSEYSMSVRKK
jgi:phage host-nuclease inhibitor protein Gam|tara:strand:- start:1121 stop:1513 length:393 start_codon:yes stop_codon:yes gene_type:complete